MFEEVILSNSTEKQAKLLEPAKRAHENPDIGVDINNKSAYYVIRDCALITQKYLVPFIWASYPDPFEALKGKFVINDIKDFLKRSEKDNDAKHLKHIIIGDIKNKFDIIVTKSSAFDYSMEEEDIYSDYFSDSEEVDSETIETEMTEEEMLVKFFDVDPNKL
tara:strand:+ start:4095 stop:4583 length:489 start_codon:yes stop_codon:yes gene_type:complete